MRVHIWLAAALAIIGTVSLAPAFEGASQETTAQDPVRAVDGEWIYVEDRTAGRTLEQLSAPMASKFSLRVEEGAVVLNGHGSGHKDVRVALDGSVTERPDGDKIARYRGGWKDGAFEYEVAF